MATIARLRLLFVVAAVFVPLTGCNPIQEERNAETTTNGYFAAVKGHEFAQATDYYAPAFFEKMPRESWRQTLESLNVKLGTLKDYKLTSWQGDARFGAGPQSGTFYTLQYDVTYTNAHANETFILQKAPDGGFKIISHQIESDGLLR
jgi:hypothetical protein